MLTSSRLSAVTPQWWHGPTTVPVPPNNLRPRQPIADPIGPTALQGGGEGRLAARWLLSLSAGIDKHNQCMSIDLLYICPLYCVSGSLRVTDRSSPAPPPPPTMFHFGRAIITEQAVAAEQITYWGGGALCMRQNLRRFCYFTRSYKFLTKL